MQSDKESPLLSSQGKDCLNCNRRLELHDLRNPHIKWTVLVQKKMSHMSRPRPCVFSMAGALWCSQHILHTVWKLCTKNDTQGWGSIHIASMAVSLAHSLSTGCPTPVASRYTTLLLCLSGLMCHQGKLTGWENVTNIFITVTIKHWNHWNGSTIHLPLHDNCKQCVKPPQHFQTTGQVPRHLPSMLLPMEFLFYLCFRNWGHWSFLFICTLESTWVCVCSRASAHTHTQHLLATALIWN